MFLSIKILADIHDCIEVLAFSVDFDSLFVLVCLNVKICCFFPVVAISLEFSLLNQNLGVEHGLITTFLSVFLNEVVSLLKLL